MMNRNGFTLIELLVVVMIMGVLTSIALPQYRKSIDRAKEAEALQLLPALYDARERWITEHQCHWVSVRYECADGETISVDKLDIESKWRLREGIPKQASTSNFTYDIAPLAGCSARAGNPAVQATFKFGISNKRSAIAYCYYGETVCCAGPKPECSKWSAPMCSNGLDLGGVEED